MVVLITYIMIVAVVFFAVMFLLTWIFSLFWCKPTRRNKNVSPEDYGLPYEDVQFPSQGRTVRGWLIGETGKTKTATVILVHGWSSSAADMLPLAVHCHGSGISVLLFDVRGHGKSEADGPITIKKFTEDIIAGLDYLGTRCNTNIGCIGVLGHSLGASAAINAASRDPRIRAMVSIAAFADPYELTKNVLKKMRLPAFPILGLLEFFIERYLGESMKLYSPVQRIGLVNVPMFLIHGDTDRIVKPGDLYTLYNNADRSITEMLPAKDCGHFSVLKTINKEHPAVRFLIDALNIRHERQTVHEITTVPGGAIQ